MAIGYAFHINPMAVYAWPADMIAAALDLIEEIADAAARR